tara:strand:- start:1399 stop:1566 length:168 start_codon:yes stop_codon:yes gene_type:complete
MKYEWTSSEKHTIKFTDDDGKEFCIPPDPDNIDYQAYLEWEAIDGNDITIMTEAY